jgi:hypothetical protein
MDSGFLALLGPGMTVPGTGPAVTRYSMAGDTGKKR